MVFGLLDVFVFDINISYRVIDLIESKKITEITYADIFQYKKSVLNNFNFRWWFTYGWALKLCGCVKLCVCYQVDILCTISTNAIELLCVKHSWENFSFDIYISNGYLFFIYLMLTLNYLIPNNLLCWEIFDLENYQ